MLIGGGLDAWLASRTRSSGNEAAAIAKPNSPDRRILWTVLALSVALVAIVAVIFFRRASTSTPVARTFRQVWTGDEVDYWNAVSPDGRYVSYTDLQTGDLGIHDLSSGQNRTITKKGKTAQESPAWAFNAAFSPDGKFVAYWWWTDDRTNEVRVVGRDGTGQRTLLRDSDHASYELMDWSPDGKFISAVIERSNQKTDLAVISARDGSVRVLKTLGEVGTQRVAFSRDSKYLAYDAPFGKDENGDIFLISVDGKTDQRVIGYPTNEFLVGWTPRGDALVFGSDRTV